MYTDPCNTAHPPYHLVHGVSTANAFGVTFSSVTPPPVYRVFTDLADMIGTGALTGGPIQPNWGCLFLSKMVWSLNIP